MDDELKGMCVQAVKNELYRKINEAVASAKAALKGIDYAPEQLYEMHAFGDCAFFARIRIYSAWTNEQMRGGTKYVRVYEKDYDNFVEAMQDENATCIWINGNLIFEKVDGEWVAPRKEG